MPNGYGRRGGNRGGGIGFGFRGAAPPWPYVGRGRGGLPRCGYNFYTGAPVSQSYWTKATPATGYTPNPTMSREEELNYMKEQADNIKGQLEQIESRISDLEAEK